MARAVQTAIDSLNFFVESRSHGNVLTATTTATGGITSADLVNTDQRGALFFITLASITVNNATLAININAKDLANNTYFPWARVSLDGLTASSSLQYMAMLFIGAASTNSSFGNLPPPVGFNENLTTINLPVPGTFQVVSSLTIGAVTATNGQTMSYSVDYSKIM